MEMCLWNHLNIASYYSQMAVTLKVSKIVLIYIYNAPLVLCSDWHCPLKNLLQFYDICRMSEVQIPVRLNLSHWQQFTSVALLFCNIVQNYE